MREQSRPAAQPPARRPWLEYLSSGILALLLAMVVWVTAAYTQDPLRTDSFEGIPIQYTNVGDGLVPVGRIEQRARVTLRAPASYWPSLTAQSVEAVADLAGLGVGVHTVDVKVRTHGRTTMVVERAPARVVVRLEERVRRSMALRPEVADPETVAPGYVTAPAKLLPEMVAVSGARSLVDSVAQVVAVVWLRGSKTSVESEVMPVALNADGAPVEGVEILPRTVRVTLGVTPLAEFRDVTIRASLKGVPAAGYWVSNITIEPAAVTIQGTPETIRNMPAVVSTAPIDLTGVNESFGKRVTLELPADVSVYSADASGQTVLVRVDVTAIVGGKTLQPLVEVQGLRSELKAAISPDTVDVIVSGPVPELQALQPGDVRVVVNLFGLRAGRHMVTPAVLLPDGSALKVESISPDAVEVNISVASGSSQ